MGIAISEEDTLTGVIIKSLTEHGAAAKVKPPPSYSQKVVRKGLLSVKSLKSFHVSV